MFRRVLPLWVIVSIIASGWAKAQMPFPRDLLPPRRALERLGLERQWFTVIPLLETERLLRISRTADLLFAQTSYARLHTIDAESGRLLWTAELAERTGFARGATANAFAVFATNANILYALDRGSGRRIWTYNLDTIPTSTPACDNSRVMVGMTNGLLVGLSLKKVDPRGNETILPAPLPLWKWHAGTALATRPLPAENVVAWGGGDSKVYCVMAAEATPVWRFATGGAIGEGLAGYGNHILLVPSADFNLYAIDLFSGNALWTFPSGAPISQEPMVAESDLYVINKAGNLSSLDPSSGEVRWTTSTQGGRTAAISATKVYLRSENLDLFTVDRATGRMVIDPSETYLRAGLNLREYDLDIVNRFSDRISFATSSGLIICLREAGQIQPKPLRDPKAAPFGYVPPEGIKATPPAAPAAEPGAEPKNEPGAEPKNEPGAAAEAAPDAEKGAAPKAEPK
jgi:outer membrane protein assembly factor BamB